MLEPFRNIEKICQIKFPVTLIMLFIFLCPNLALAVTKQRNENDIQKSSVKHGIDSKTKVSYMNIPLFFIENQGQLPKKVRYCEKGKGHEILFAEDGVYFSLLSSHGKMQKHENSQMATKNVTKNPKRYVNFELSFLNAKPHPQIIGEGEKTGKVNYFKGKDPNKWKINIPTYGAVTYKNVYKGIDIKFYGDNKSLEYDIIVHPGADISRMKFSHEGIEDLHLSENGDLVINAKDGTLIHKRPCIYQEINGKRIEREGSFRVINNKTYAFNVRNYDQNYVLILDPVLAFSAYLGGSADDEAAAMVIDNDGNICIAGETRSSDFITQDPYQHIYGDGDGDAFVSKLSGDGSSLIFSTFFGGSSWDYAKTIEVDNSGNIYVAGSTRSSNFPVMNAFQGNRNGGGDAFVAKFSGDGYSLIFSTYLGGNSYEGINGLGIDTSYNICVAGYTFSTDFPTENPFQEEHGGSNFDGFITKLSANGSSLIFSTYFGGTYTDYIHNLVLDGENNVIVTGYTDSSSDFPIYQAVQGGYGGNADAFVSKFSPSGASLVFSTFLGGGSADEGRDLSVDSKGNIYVAGSTRSSNFPTKNPIQQNHNGGQYDAFVTEISGDGTTLLFSTFLGGGTGMPGLKGWDMAYALTVDESKNIYVAGFTNCADFPLENAFQKSSSGSSDAFVSMISADHSRLIFSTYLGGNSSDFANALALNGAGNLYVAGATDGFDEPTAGGLDAFVVYIYEPIIFTGDRKPCIPPTSETKRHYNYHGANKCQGAQSGPGPVFVKSGDFYHEHTDILIRSRGIGLDITRYYNTQDLYDGPFGHGWNMDYTTLLVQTEEEGVTYATVRRGSGLRIKLTDNGDGTYTPPLGSHDTLVKNPDGTFTLNGTCESCARRPLPAYHFNTDGSLASIQDMNSNTITIENDVNGRISTVTDANNRSLTFSYGSNGRVETITDFSIPARQWTYGYDENDNLITVTDPDDKTIQYQYDDHHNLTAIVDARGNTVSSMGYDDNDKVVSFTNKGGTYGIEYDPVSNLTTKIDPEGKIFSFNYDVNGNITNKLNPKNDTLNLTWDANINVTGKENARGIETAYTYDDRGNLLSVTRDSGAGGSNLTTLYEYDTRFDKVTKITPPLGEGYETTFIYDDNGNLTERHSPTGTNYFLYDSNGNLTQTTDPDGYISAMEYNPNGYLTRVYVPGTDPVIETTYTHDERGNILTKTDPNGNITTYHYDGLDRLQWVEDATPKHNRTSFEYDANGNLILIRDPKLNETKFEYDQHNQLFKRIDGNASPTLKRETEYAYDSRGNLTSVTDPLDHTTTYEYDELNQLVKIIDHLNYEWAFTHDASGNLLTKTDPNLNTTSYTYDAVNRLKTVIDAEGNATPDPDDHKTIYNYDLNGNLLTIIDANGHTAVTNTYYTSNRLETTKDPVQPTAASFTYYPSGRIQTRTDANGTTTTYAYEALTGRLEKIQYAGGREEAFTYDRAGNILSISDNQTGLTVSYNYDELNRVTSETQLGQTITYTYDDVGNRSTMNVPGVGNFHYYYDDLNRLAYMVNHLDQMTEYEYFANDLRKKMTYHNGSYTEYAYDEVNRLDVITHKKSDGTVIESYDYSYDSMNNRVSVTYGGNTVSYGYDKTYKLKSQVHPEGTISYTYDPVGNRLSLESPSKSVEYFYDEDNRLTHLVENNDRPIFFYYDNNGNLKVKEIIETEHIRTEYDYDEKDQLVQVNFPFDDTSSFFYDPTGRRVRGTGLGSTWGYLYDGQNAIKEFNVGDSDIYYIYTPSLTIDDLVSIDEWTDGTSFYLRDGLNSVCYLLNPDETVKASYDFTPFGKISNSTGSSGGRSPFTFTGRRSDSLSGLMYYRSRYYDPVVGRFLKKDRFKGTLDDPLSLHRYAYVLNNPVNFLDPFGLWWKKNEERLERVRRDWRNAFSEIKYYLTGRKNRKKFSEPFPETTIENIYQNARTGKKTGWVELGQAIETTLLEEPIPNSGPITSPEEFLENMYHGDRLSYDRWQKAKKLNFIPDPYTIADPYLEKAIERDQERLLQDKELSNIEKDKCN